MSMRAFFALFALSWGLSLVFMMPDMGLILTLFTFGLGLVVMVPTMTMAIYLPALFPVLRRQTRWRLVVSCALVAVVAAGPHWWGERKGQIERRAYLAEDKVATALDRPVRIIDFEGMSFSKCDELCRALLTGGMVEKIRVKDSQGKFERYFTTGGRGPFLDLPDPDETPDVIVRDTGSTDWSDRNTLGFKVKSKSRQIISDGRTGDILVQTSSLSYETAFLPTFVMPNLGGLTSGGNDGGLYIGRVTNRGPSIGGDDQLMMRLSGLGIPLNDPHAPLSEPTLDELRIMIDGAPIVDGRVSVEAKKSVEKWIGRVTENETISPEDLEYFDMLQISAAHHTRAMSHAMLSHRQLRSIYLEEFVNRLEGRSKRIGLENFKWLLRELPHYRLPERDAAPLRDRMATAIEKTLPSVHSEYTVRLILVAAAFGVDPVPYFDRLDLTRAARVPSTLYWLSVATCAATKEERIARQQSIANLLVQTMEARRVINRDATGILRVLHITGMEGFVEDFSNALLSERDIQYVKGPVPLQDENRPARALKAELEAGCGRSKARVTKLD